MKKIFKISKNLIAENLQKKIIWSIIQINLILKIKIFREIIQI